MTHGSVAKKVRERKERYPQDYCMAKNCLWRVHDTPCCPKHARELLAKMEAEAPNA